MSVPVSRAEDQALPSQKQQVTPLTVLTPYPECTFKVNVHLRGLLFERNRRNSFHCGDGVGNPQAPAVSLARHGTPLSREPPRGQQASRGRRWERMRHAQLIVCWMAAINKTHKHFPGDEHSPRPGLLQAGGTVASGVPGAARDAQVPRAASRDRDTCSRGLSPSEIRHRHLSASARGQGVADTLLSPPSRAAELLQRGLARFGVPESPDKAWRAAQHRGGVWRPR
ncbi:unnamed protein product [Coccothraustes coccothraustes]